MKFSVEDVLNAVYDYPDLVKNLRKPLEPVVDQGVRSYNTHPNDVLLSYFLEEDHGSSDLVNLLRNPRVLEGLAVSEVRSLPEILAVMLTEGDEMHSLAARIRIDTGSFACGYHDEILIATAVPRVYTFPSGEQIEYFSLVNEVSANVPITTDGFSFSSEGIFVRENSLKMLMVMAELIGVDLSEEDARGVIINHERIEGLVKEIGLTPFEHENYINLLSSLSLPRLGVPLSSYLLYHQIHSIGGKAGANVSNYEVERIISHL
tara:strand:+ start:383 stop:1171 length:789 start_codon:yes stop_codon:yes gene_type:complete